MNAVILATGTYVPERRMSNHDFESYLDTSDEWIVSHTGIRWRHIAAEDQAVSDLATEAAHKALQRAEVSPEELNIILLATATPDYPGFPATACIVQDRIGAVNAAAMDITAGCTGFIYGLETAKGFIASGFARKVLLIGAEVLSRHIDWQDRNTCVLFGDGAGAAVITAEPKGPRLRGGHLGADGSMAKLLHLPGGGSASPPTHETIDKGLHFLEMRGREVFKAAVLSMERAVDVLLKQEGVDRHEIRWLIPHQANLRIIKVLGDYLDLPPEKVHKNIQDYGNTSAATTAIGLHLVNSSGEFEPGSKIVIVAFGGGFTWGACLIEC